MVEAYYFIKFLDLFCAILPIQHSFDSASLAVGSLLSVVDDVCNAEVSFL